MFIFQYLCCCCYFPGTCPFYSMQLYSCLFLLLLLLPFAAIAIKCVCVCVREYVSVVSSTAELSQRNFHSICCARSHPHSFYFYSKHIFLPVAAQIHKCRLSVSFGESNQFIPKTWRWSHHIHQQGTILWHHIRIHSWSRSSIKKSNSKGKRLCHRIIFLSMYRCSHYIQSRIIWIIWHCLLCAFVCRSVYTVQFVLTVHMHKDGNSPPKSIARYYKVSMRTPIPDDIGEWRKSKADEKKQWRKIVHSLHRPCEMRDKTNNNTNNQKTRLNANHFNFIHFSYACFLSTISLIFLLLLLVLCRSRTDESLFCDSFTCCRVLELH